MPAAMEIPSRTMSIPVGCKKISFGGVGMRLFGYVKISSNWFENGKAISTITKTAMMLFRSRHRNSSRWDKNGISLPFESVVFFCFFELIKLFFSPQILLLMGQSNQLLLEQFYHKTQI